VRTDIARGARRAKHDRGSGRRVARLRIRGNSSSALWILIAWVAFLLLVVVPWMIHQTP